MKKTRRAVERPLAETYIFISLVAFGVTVAATRIFLQWAGYPQVGNSVLHIAHAIWGGLLLFVAVLATLTLANRWAFTLSALLSGIGVGLFIDEVGKFITQKNDYFYPPAAPIIYSLFLLMVLFLVMLRRSHHKSPRSSMYRVVLGLREVLDNDLDTRERDQLLAELANGRSAPQPHIVLLAEQLTAYLQDEANPVLEYRPGFWTRFQRKLRAMGARLGRKNHRRIIIALTALIGLYTLLIVALLVLARVYPSVAELLLSSLIVSAAELTTQQPVWLVVRLVMQLGVGLLYAYALLQLVRGREEAGINAAIFASLLSLTVVYLLNFYLNQFSALASLFVSLAFFFLLLAYRAWYLPAGGDE